MKKIMILGASILQLPAIKKAKEMGLEVVVVDMNPDAVGFQTEGIEKEIISTIDIPEIVKAAKRHSSIRVLNDPNLYKELFSMIKRKQLGIKRIIDLS